MGITARESESAMACGCCSAGKIVPCEEGGEKRSEGRKKRKIIEAKERSKMTEVWLKGDPPLG